MPEFGHTENSETEKIFQNYQIPFAFFSQLGSLLPTFYLVIHTPPPLLLSQSQTGLDRSPGSSSWSLRCQWSGKLQERKEARKKT